MYLKILNDDFDSGINTSVGSGVVVYGRTAPFSNLDEYERSRKRQKKAKKHSPRKKLTTSRRSYDDED